MKTGFRNLRRVLSGKKPYIESEPMYICEDLTQYIRSLNWPAVHRLSNRLIRTGILLAHALDADAQEDTRKRFPECFEFSATNLSIADLRIIFEALATIRGEVEFPENWIWDTCAFLGLHDRRWFENSRDIPPKVVSQIVDRTDALGSFVFYKGKPHLVAALTRQQGIGVTELVLYRTDLIRPKISA